MRAMQDSLSSAGTQPGGFAHVLGAQDVPVPAIDRLALIPAGSVGRCLQSQGVMRAA